MRRLLPLVFLMGLVGCQAVTAPVTSSTATRDLATAQQIVSTGQLVCKLGPTFFQMVSPSGAALLAKGAPKAAVDAACGAVNGVASALTDVSVTPNGIVLMVPPVTLPTS